MSEIGTAIEALSKTLGVWWPGIGEIGPSGLTLTRRLGGQFTVRRWPDVDSSDGVTRAVISAHEALVWLLMRARPEREQCPTCAGAKVEREVKEFTGQSKMSYARGTADNYAGRGWATTLTKIPRGKAPRAPARVRVEATRPCSTCRPPDLDVPTLADLDRIVGQRATLGFYGWQYNDDPLEWAPPAGVLGRDGHWLTVDGKRCALFDEHGRRGTPHLKVRFDPTGHVETHRWSDLFLRALPCSACGGRGGTSAKHGEMVQRFKCTACAGSGGRDPDARDALAVRADSLQSAGEPIGEWLALLLARSPCGACREGVLRETVSRQGAIDGALASVERTGGLPELPRRIDDRTSELVTWCDACTGTGLAIGAHTQAMVEAAMRVADEIGS